MKPATLHGSARKTDPGVRNRFDLSGRVAVITGGGGLLGTRHAEAVAEMGGRVVLVDRDGARARTAAEGIADRFGSSALGLAVDITHPDAVADMVREILGRFGRLDILINNAARNPTQAQLDAAGGAWSRLEQFPMEEWHLDMAVGLTGTFLCSRHAGMEMAARGRGVILNIASDLAVIAPDQRIYRRPDVAEDQQPAKPVSYSVVKHGVIGLTRYLATYWADRGIRVNALSPGGVYTGQDAAFVDRLAQLIPMGRMAEEDEYKAAVVFLVSDASSYMTGANLVMDGGRTVW